jgi:cobalt transporter subunit CbtB
MLSPTMTTTAAVPTLKAATLAQALLAASLGVFILWAVGFSHLSVFHNAAHDVRHSNAFPCH